MIISTSSHNILLFNELDDFVVDTMTRTLERLADDVLSVDVFLKDINGPKGGVDKQVIVRRQAHGARRPPKPRKIAAH